jgi:hypothetical protein
MLRSLHPASTRSDLPSWAGDHEAVLDQLEPLLAMPYTLTPGWLRIDPMFDPRKHPRFVKLVEGMA